MQRFDFPAPNVGKSAGFRERCYFLLESRGDRMSQPNGERIEILYKGIATANINKIAETLSPLPISSQPKIIVEASPVAGTERLIVVSLGRMSSAPAKGFFEEAGKDLWKKWKPIVEAIINKGDEDSENGRKLHFDFEFRGHGFEITAKVEISSESEVEGSLKGISEVSSVVENMVKRRDLPATSGDFYIEYDNREQKWKPKAIITYEPYFKKYYSRGGEWVEE